MSLNDIIEKIASGEGDYLDTYLIITRLRETQKYIESLSSRIVDLERGQTTVDLSPPFHRISEF
jgi:hypothetical protein